LQCKSGYCIADSEDFFACGTCLALVGNGDRCAGNTVCDVGLSCDAAERCAPYLQRGDACDGTTAACDTRLFCSDGRCTDVGGAGSPCTDDLECDYFQGQVCSYKGLCESPHGVYWGGECGFPDKGHTQLKDPTFCVAGFSCEDSGHVYKGRCEPQLKDGAGCETSVFQDPCWPPASCVDGLCQLPTPAPCD
jgi:hypothetical protein